jgi:tripartite-type tricarboxylate transporter receptor subunit TctC
MEEKIGRQEIFRKDRRKMLITVWIACKKGFVLALIALGFLSLGQDAQAQEYPMKPITILIGNAPGAGTDLCSRVIAQEAKNILGQEFIPINKPGGNGAVAAGIVAKSKGDGYTLLACTGSTLTSVPHLESVTYDPLKDFIPIIQFGTITSGLIVRSDSPHKSFKDLIEFARKNPGKVSYGVPGIGTPGYLTMQWVIQKEKVNIVIIPFGGSAPAMAALLGGHVTFCSASTSGFIEHFKAGKVRVLATRSEKRLEVIPDVPTLFEEIGYHAKVSEEMYLIMAPKGTDSAVVKRLEEAFLRAMETPAFKTIAENRKLYVENPLYGQKLKDHIEDGYKINGEIIRKAKLGKYK